MINRAAGGGCGKVRGKPSSRGESASGFPWEEGWKSPGGRKRDGLLRGRALGRSPGAVTSVKAKVCGGVGVDTLFTFTFNFDVILECECVCVASRAGNGDALEQKECMSECVHNPG